MAGDWIKMERGTPEKPEVLAITVRMGWDDPDLTVGKLFKLWCWFDQHTTDGNAVGVSPALLDRYLSAQGFINAVALSGWVVINDDGLSLPNFDKHNGASAKKRGLTAKRVANHKTNAETNAESVSETLGERYLEKRREEKSNTVTNVTGGKPPMLIKDVVYGYALPMLTNSGVPDKSARSFLGALLKNTPEDHLRNAIRECMREGPLAPLEWLAKACAPPATQNKQERLESKNRQVVEELLRERQNAEAR